MYLNYWLHKFSTVVFIVVAWQIGTIAIGNHMLWPNIWDVVLKLFELLQRVNFLKAIYNSVFLTLTAFGILSVLAVTISSFTHNIAWLRRMISTFSDLIGPTPTLSWLPVFLIFFGFSKATVYILMIWAVLWLAIPGFYSLLDMSKQTWHRQIDNLGLSKYQALRHVYVPSMLQGFLSLSKTYLMFMWRVLFSLEIVFGAVGGHIGIGTTMYDFKGKFDHLEVYACLLIIMVLGAVMNKMFGTFERKH